MRLFGILNLTVYPPKRLTRALLSSERQNESKSPERKEVALPKSRQEPTPST